MSRKSSSKEDPVLQEDPAQTEPSADTEQADAPVSQEEAAPEAAEQAPAAEDPAAALQRRVAEAEEALAGEQKKYQYLAAEYDNFRRRSVKEKSDAYASAKSDAVQAFLPVYDNLERALKTPCADEAYAKGVEMTMTQFRQILEKLGVTEIKALGEKFDPNLHNAVMHVEDENEEESTVVDVFQSGFKLGDKVIRCAMVKVAN